MCEHLLPDSQFINTTDVLGVDGVGNDPVPAARKEWKYVNRQYPNFVELSEAIAVVLDLASRPFTKFSGPIAHNMIRARAESRSREPAPVPVEIS